VYACLVEVVGEVGAEFADGHLFLDHDTNVHEQTLGYTDVKLISLTQAKAECAGRTVVLVNPAYTSRMCSGCGQITDRDVNAAINILRAGTALRRATA
jgi:hypothetical protein